MKIMVDKNWGSIKFEGVETDFFGEECEGTLEIKTDDLNVLLEFVSDGKVLASASLDIMDLLDLMESTR